MRSRLTAPVLAVLTLFGTGVVRAQEPGHVGLTMGYPTAVGVIWHVADRLALRPDLSLSQSSGDSTTTTAPQIGSPSSNNSWQVGIGLSAFFYVARWDALRVYVGPRFAYSRSTTTSSSSSSSLSASVTDGTASSYSTTGSFGAQYLLGPRFAVFGEIGLSYTTITSDTTGITTITLSSFGVPFTGESPIVSTFRNEAHSRSVSPRSGAGVIFYF